MAVAVDSMSKYVRDIEALISDYEIQASSSGRGSTHNGDSVVTLVRAIVATAQSVQALELRRLNAKYKLPSWLGKTMKPKDDAALLLGVLQQGSKDLLTAGVFMFEQRSSM
jgi:uncharacterized protein YqgV (UPF0045/DUF77 family)